MRAFVRYSPIVLAFVLFFGTIVPGFVIAQEFDADPPTGLQQEIREIEDEVRERERRVKSFDQTITSYESRIKQQAQTAKTLQDQLTLLETQIEIGKAKVGRSKERILLLNSQIVASEKTLAEQTALLEVRETLLEDALRELNRADGNASPWQAIITKRSVSAYIAERSELVALERGLLSVTEELQAQKKRVEENTAQLQDERKQAEEERLALEKEQERLALEQAAKQSLVAETANREQEYRRLVSDLRIQQQNEADLVSSLQARLREKLDQADDQLAQGNTILAWPVPVLKGISAHFHDEAYPFRHLFEHTGVDLPVPVGTPVRAAAGGYVAWTRLGRQYGNYIMIIHPNNVATVYAHLSGFAVKADTYVERGEVIAYSGGKAGEPGSGLSTGPHLHFEVRQNGIPVNPENYLPSLD